MPITRNQAAFATASVASFATVGSVIAASTSDSKASTAAFSVLAIASSAGTIGSLSAWAATEKCSAAEGLWKGISTNVEEFISGKKPDKKKPDGK